MFNGFLRTCSSRVSMPPSSIFAKEKCEEGIWRHFGECLCRENLDVLPCYTSTWSQPKVWQEFRLFPDVSWAKYQHVSTLNKNGHTKAKKYDIQLHLLPYSFFSERKWKKLKETERGNCSHGNTRTRVVLSVHACDFCGKLCNRLTSARATQRLYRLMPIVGE